MTDSAQEPASKLAPFRIDPKFDVRVWGWQDLRPWFDRVAAPGQPLGEVWLTGDMCTVATGPDAGKRLDALFAEVRQGQGANALLGPAAPSSESPLLIKVLFAREKLSVQVHPDDRMARKYGNPNGKTECWYALAAEPEAEVAVGLKPGVTLEQVRDEIRGGTLESSLNVLPVCRGDVIFVDAGTVHAIWPGSVLLETQQNCDLTYRMYDYGRPRELHIEKALEATKLVTGAGKVAPTELRDRTILIDADYFRVERISVAGRRSSRSLLSEDRPVPGLAYLFAAGGGGRIVGPEFAPVALPPRGIVAVPASSPDFAVEDLDLPEAPLDLIRITPNWPTETD